MSLIFTSVRLARISRRNYLNSTYEKCFLIRGCKNPLQRHFSVQNTVESLIASQTGIFKTLSESSFVEYTQKSLLAVHDITGLPWWATIITTTCLIRTTITLPLAVYQYHILARLENIKLEMPAIVNEMKKEMAVAIKMYKWDEKTAQITYNRSLQKQWTKLIERENCHPLKTSLLIFIQIPMWISLSVAIRNLVYMLPAQTLEAHITFTELSVGGFGIIPNLTVPDFSWIFPFALGFLNLAIIELQVLSQVNKSSRLSKVLVNFFRGFSILMIPIAASVPSCLVLYWTTSSAYGLVQNLVLLSPKIRRICRIPKTEKELKKPYEHIVQKFTKKCNKLNIFGQK